MGIGDSKAIVSCVQDIRCTQVGDLSLYLMYFLPSKDVDHQISLHGCRQNLLTKGRKQCAVHPPQTA